MLEIGIYGDSYAVAKHDSTGEQPWVNIITKDYNNKLISTPGRPGTSAWYAYSKFLKDLKNHETIKRVVFVYTAMYRIPYLPEEHATCSFINTSEWLRDDQQQLYNVIESYANYLYNKDLNEFICQNIFNSVQKICKDKDIKLVNIIPFDGAKQDYNEYNISKKEGPIVYGLDTMSCKEAGGTVQYYRESSRNNWKNSIHDNRLCHLNQENNIQVAEKVIELLKSTDTNTVTDFSELSISSPELWSRYSNAPYYNS